MKDCVPVVDAGRKIVKAIGILPEKEGYEALKANDGLQAPDILSTPQVRLALIDVMMPRLDGLSAVMRIREPHPSGVLQCLSSLSKVSQNRAEKAGSSPPAYK